MMLMKNGTIGHIDHGKTTVAGAIKNVLIELSDSYHYLDSQTPSKTQLKKCRKGLHEFLKTHHETIGVNMFIPRWSCRHCGTFMHER